MRPSIITATIHYFLCCSNNDLRFVINTDGAVGDKDTGGWLSVIEKNIGSTCQQRNPKAVPMILYSRRTTKTSLSSLCKLHDT